MPIWQTEKHYMVTPLYSCRLTAAFQLSGKGVRSRAQRGCEPPADAVV